MKRCGYRFLKLATTGWMLIPCLYVPHVMADLNSAQASPDLLRLDWAPVDLAELAEARGGFTLASNVQIDLGFESIVMIDGVLRSQNKLFLEGLSTNNLQSVLATHPVGSASGLPAAGGGSLPLSQIIQNSADNQVIESLKVLDIKFSNLGTAQSGPLHQLMNLQLIESLR